MADEELQQGQEEQQPQHDSGTPEGMLDRFIQETDRAPQQPVPGQEGEAGQGTARAPQGREQGRQGQGRRGEQQQPQQGGQGDGTTRTVQQIPQAARQFGRMFLADGKGDIYDSQGTLITKQGYGRTVFHKLYPYIEGAVSENAQLKQRLESYENANAIAKQNGLTLDDHSAAMQLMVQWKKNPLETLNTLLKVAQDRGIDVSAIRGGGVDVSALQSSLDELMEKKLARFAPFVQQQEQQARDAELNEVVIGEYNTFMQEFPDAAPHQGAIARVMRDQNMTHREAYFAVRAFAAHHQLDWNQSLEQQLDARTKQSGNGQQPGNGRALPPMNGRTGMSDTVAAGSRDAGSGDESWDSIARRTFRAHGIDIQ